MKTSNKLLAALALVIVIAGLGFLIGARYVIHKLDLDVQNGIDIGRLSGGKLVEKEYDYSGFSKLSFKGGGWRVKVDEGDTYAVTLRIPEGLEEYVDVEKRGSHLKIGTRDWLDLDGQHFEARIIMPELSELSTSGGFDAILSGFNGNVLFLEGNGGLNITAEDCRYEDLQVKTSGGVNADFRDMPVKNARVETSGALHMTLTMDGGELTGHVSGVASLDYYGEVSKNTLSVSGVSNISHRSE